MNKPTDGSQPLVTIGIPTYNRSDRYLRQTLASALSQTWGNLEVVVWDNCSTDGTEDYLRSIDDDRLRYFRQERPVTPNANFNDCLEQARGEWFLLLHDDDAIDPTMVETCMTALRQAPLATLIVGGTRVIDGDGKTTESRPNVAGVTDARGLIENWMAGRTVLFLCGCLFHTTTLREVGGFHSVADLLQDVIAELKVAAQGVCLNVPTVLSSFRRHEGEITQSSNAEDWRRDSQELLRVMINIGGPDIARTANRQLTALNYRRAAAIPSRSDRLRAMWETYRMFGRAGSHPLKKTVLDHPAIKGARRLMRLALPGRS